MERGGGKEGGREREKGEGRVGVCVGMCTCVCLCLCVLVPEEVAYNVYWRPLGLH